MQLIKQMPAEHNTAPNTRRNLSLQNEKPQTPVEAKSKKSPSNGEEKRTFRFLGDYELKKGEGSPMHPQERTNQKRGAPINEGKNSKRNTPLNQSKSTTPSGHNRSFTFTPDRALLDA